MIEPTQGRRPLLVRAGLVNRQLAFALVSLIVVIPARGTAQSQGSPTVIGVENGPPEAELFGFITDVEVSETGDVFILDRFANHVAWFDGEGRFVQHIGRPGPGPGEFGSAMRMALDPRRMQLHVYDESRRQVSIYSVGGPEAVHLGDQRVEEPITDLCFLGSRRFVVFPRRDPVIAELDTTGRAIRSFAEAEAPDQPTARRLGPAVTYAHDYYNAALLGCDEESGTIVLLHENVPIVRAYSISGGLRWRGILESYKARQLYVPTGSHPASIGARIDPELRAAHAASAIAIASSNRVVVTLWEGSASDIEGRLEARILDLADGTQVDNITPPSRLAQVIGGRAYAFARAPFPRVLVYGNLRPWLR